jgi:tetratricopeptide (TPR) repeat protein
MGQSPQRPDAGTGTYSLSEVAGLLGIPASRVRGFVRSRLVEPERGKRGALLFSFRDVAFLRRVRDLGAGRIPPRRVRRALERLRETLAPEQDLGRLPISAAAGQVVLREGEQLWSPETGQYVFDFEPEPRQRVVTLVPAPREAGPAGEPSSGDAWYHIGRELRETDPARAAEALERAVELDPKHADAHVDLGCLCHASGALAEAERHYRAALAERPADPTARFDLAVVLEDRGDERGARAEYERALAADPACADAHFNLARLCERAGDQAGVIRHLLAYRRLVPEERR